MSELREKIAGDIRYCPQEHHDSEGVIWCPRSQFVNEDLECEYCKASSILSHFRELVESVKRKNPYHSEGWRGIYDEALNSLLREIGEE